MHRPRHRYTTDRRKGVYLKPEDRWGCLQTSTKTLCNVRHNAEDYAKNHCKALNKNLRGQQKFKPKRIHRIERYSKTDLLYRGWTQDMIQKLLGQPDAEDRGTHYVYEPCLYDADRVHNAEATPSFDQAAAKARNSGEITTLEEDFSAVISAITENLHVNLPTINTSSLISHITEHVQQNTAKNLAHKFSMNPNTRCDQLELKDMVEDHHQYHTGDDYLEHAVRSFVANRNPAHAFSRQYRHHYLFNQADDILMARISNALYEIAPDLRTHLAPYLRNYYRDPPYLDQLPEPGMPLPWTPGKRVKTHNQTAPPSKYHNITNLRWARYRTGPPNPPKMPHWGNITITTNDNSLTQPFTQTRPVLSATPPEIIQQELHENLQVRLF